jgi:ribosomal protein S18 acetylase RimI-like enzyme
LLVKPSTAARVRQVEEDDLTELSELDSVVFGNLAYPYFVLRQFFDVHRGELLVAEEDGRLRGYSFAVRASAPGLGWFLGLGVEPTSRRRGYGLALARTSLDILREQQVTKVLLCVHRGNSPAVSLYRKLGFRLADEVEDYLGPGETRQLLELRLHPALTAPPPGGR